MKPLEPDEIYGLAVDPNLCTGCGVCEAVCNKDAIYLMPLESIDYEQLQDSPRNSRHQPR